MKHSLKFCRFSIVLLLALTVAFSAAVGVSADNFECPARMWVANNFNQGKTSIRYLVGNGATNQSVTPTTGFHLGIEADCQFQNNTSYIFAFTVNSQSGEIWYSDYYNILQLHSGEVSSLYQESPNNYFNKANFQTTGYNDDGNITYIVSFNTSGDDLAYTYNKIYFAWVTQLSGTTSYTYKFQSVTAYATYDPEGATLSDIQTSIQNILNQNTTNTTNIINKIDQIISNQNSSNTNIQESLGDIIDNQEIQNQYWEQIINYGNTYNQIDQTIINNLGSAEDQLSSAEGAIENKSKSLMQQASSGISKATTASQTLVTSLTTTIPQVYTFASDIIEVTPPEVQAAVLAIPLLSFAVWLIGLRR